MAAIRILAEPNDPKDLVQVHALQDAVKISQANKGQFDIPNWDQASQKARDALFQPSVSERSEWRHDGACRCDSRTTVLRNIVAYLSVCRETR